MDVNVIYSEDFGALYVNGKLDTTGPIYWIDERIGQLLEVERTHFDDFAFEDEKDFPELLDEALAKQAGYEERLADEEEALEAQADVDLARAVELEAEAKRLRERHNR